MSAAPRLALTRPLAVFGVTWLGQLVSVIGSGLTSFALGVEVYQRTRSTTQFALVSFFYFLPLTALSPLAGALVDRWDRRIVMLCADLGAAASTLLIFAMLAARDAGLWPLQPWHFYVPIALSSACATFRGPAYQASASLLAPKQHLTRMNALIDLATAAGQLVSPVLAGFLVMRAGLRAVVLVDLATFVFSISTLLLVRFPKPPLSAVGQAGKGSLKSEILQGLRFLWERPGLLGLLAFVFVSNLLMGIVTVLITPLVLAFTDVSTLGVIMSVAGLGMLAGGLVMSAWGGPRRRILAVFGFELLAGVALILAAMPPTVFIVMVGAALYLFTAAPMGGCMLAIWQVKVAPDLQGRIFSVRRMITMAAPPLGNLAAGVLADRFFEPWLAQGGALADSVGKVIGTGPGRGIGFLFVVLGVLTWANALWPFLVPRVRNVEDELPDALPEPVPAAAADAPASRVASI